MITASFGGLLKDFRIRKDLSQRDVAYAMGWSEPSRLSRIEQGKTKKPTRENVHQLFEAMRLSKIERNKLLLAGGYLPTEEELMRELKRERLLVETQRCKTATSGCRNRLGTQCCYHGKM